MEKIRRMRQQLGEWGAGVNIWDQACRLGKLVPERRDLLRKPP